MNVGTELMIIVYQYYFSNMIMWLFDPFTAGYTYATTQMVGNMSYPSTTKIGYNSRGGGVVKLSSTSITGISFTNRDSYNIDSLRCRIYGLKQ